MNSKMKELIGQILDIGVVRNQEFIRLLAIAPENRDWAHWDELNQELQSLKERLFQITLEAYVDETRYTK